MGAGFQKVPWCDVSITFGAAPSFAEPSCMKYTLMEQLYELRWPRLQKIYEPRERPWTEGMSVLTQLLL